MKKVISNIVISLIVVGKLKDKELESLENNYLKRLKKDFFKIVECKSHKEDLYKEFKEVNKSIQSIKNNNSKIILLTEKGRLFDSKIFSKTLYKFINNSINIIFVIGGASGHHDKMYELADSELSLSKLTFPHKLARLLFVEQIYRAVSINENHPYHK